MGSEKGVSMIRKPILPNQALKIVPAITLGLLLSACGQPATGSGNVSITSNALAGPSAASIYRSDKSLFALFDRVGGLFSSALLGIRTAYAAVTPFTSFKACNNTLILRDQNGDPISINGSTSLEAGRGLLDFSPTSTAPMTLGSLSIPTGTQISRIDITFAATPSICGGASYAVQFDAGGGPIDITQNTAFRFDFASPKTIAEVDAVNLKFGNIVDAMAALGGGLNNSTIQNVAIGIGE